MDTELVVKALGIVAYIIEENFGQKHLDALSKIVSALNYSEESEREVLEFTDGLYKKYGGKTK